MTSIGGRRCGKEKRTCRVEPLNSRGADADVMGARRDADDADDNEHSRRRLSDGGHRTDVHAADADAVATPGYAS